MFLDTLLYILHLNHRFTYAVLVVVAICYCFYKRYTRLSIAHLPGPKPESFLVGNLRQMFQGEAAEVDFKWQQQFGDVVKISAPFGENRLLISDPKALQYIYQKSGYDFCKQPERLEVSRLIAGRGILWADGDTHKRHRAILQPGFGAPEAKAFVPLFFTYASKLTNKWKEIIESNAEPSTVFDTPAWLSRAMLDTIGQAAFDYSFNALENSNDELVKGYFNLLSGTFGSPSTLSIFIQSVVQYLPMSLLTWISDNSPSVKLERARHTAELANTVAKTLVDSKAKALESGEGSRDILSLLVKANLSEAENKRLNEEEMLAQMRTIMFAGHETSSNTISWALLELARYPAMQDRLRLEIRAMESVVHARGDVDFTAADFENMPYTSAFLKEVLRFHPVVFNNYRQAAKDDILPLSTPVTTASGEIISEIPIPKGCKIITSIAGYNRNKDLFGADAHTFNPQRWIDGLPKQGVSVGVYANLLSFAGGVRSCIGWRFAVLEMTAFIVELLNNFEFSLTQDAYRIRRTSAVVMLPQIDGQVNMGAQLPLRVSMAPRGE